MTRLASIGALIVSAAVLTGCVAPPPSGPIDWQVDLGDPGFGAECSEEFAQAYINAAAAEGETLERETDLSTLDFDEYIVAAVGEPWCMFSDTTYYSIDAIYLTPDWESLRDTLGDSGLGVDEADPDNFYLGAGDESHLGSASRIAPTPELDAESTLIHWALAGE